MKKKFFKLLDNFKNLKINIYLTSDETSKDKFHKIFKLYSSMIRLVKLIKMINNILLCDNFDFDNWTSILNQADYVITPESGCTHIASLTETKLCVIYDADNSPNMIAVNMRRGIKTI